MPAIHRHRSRRFVRSLVRGDRACSAGRAVRTALLRRHRFPGETGGEGGAGTQPVRGDRIEELAGLCFGFETFPRECPSARFELPAGQICAAHPRVDLHEHPVRGLVQLVELQPPPRKGKGGLRLTRAEAFTAQCLEQLVERPLHPPPHPVLPLVELEAIAQGEPLEKTPAVEPGSRFQVSEAGVRRVSVQQRLELEDVDVDEGGVELHEVAVGPDAVLAHDISQMREHAPDVGKGALLIKLRPEERSQVLPGECPLLDGEVGRERETLAQPDRGCPIISREQRRTE